MDDQSKISHSSSLPDVCLPPPDTTGGMPLMDALQRRLGLRADQVITLTQPVGFSG